MTYTFEVSGELQRTDSANDLVRYAVKRFDTLFEHEVTFKGAVVFQVKVRSDEKISDRELERIAFFLQESFNKKYDKVHVERL